jgi:hypothetical protein
VPTEPGEVIGAMQSEAEFEAAFRELETCGIDRARISVVAQEETASSCAEAVGCDITNLPRVPIALGDDRQQLRTLVTSLAATGASLVGGAAIAAMGATPVILAALAALVSGGSIGGLAALFGRQHESESHAWAEQQVLQGGILLIVHPADAEQFDTATNILKQYRMPASV